VPLRRVDDRFPRPRSACTDPTVSTDSPEYREIFATEAKTPNQAIAKVRPLANRRRLRAYLATGTYRHELADARWVA
jgi:hypothetical protein